MNISLNISSPQTRPQEKELVSSNGNFAVETKNLSVFYGSFKAINNVTMQIERLKITAMIGPSGCGKSTMLRAFNRMNDLIPTARAESEVHFHGQNIYKNRRSHARIVQAVYNYHCHPQYATGCARIRFHSFLHHRLKPCRFLDGIWHDHSNLYQSYAEDYRRLHYRSFRVELTDKGNRHAKREPGPQDTSSVG